MKRLSAILLLAILLFNFYGYRLVIDCMQDHQATLLDSRLDKDQYNESELVSIKMPMNLPYYTNSAAYERVYGSVQINGVEYKYVKRRVYHDSLELLCLPNKMKSVLQSAANELIKQSLDGSSSQQEKRAPHVIQVELPDYFQEFATLSIGAPGKMPVIFFFANSVIPKTDYSSLCDHPPQSMPSLT